MGIPLRTGKKVSIMAGNLLLRLLGLLFGLLALGLSFASLIDRRIVLGLIRYRPGDEPHRWSPPPTFEHFRAGFCVSGLKKYEAEELLDWLEAHGFRDLELTYESSGFCVRCK